MADVSGGGGPVASLASTIGSVRRSPAPEDAAARPLLRTRYGLVYQRGTGRESRMPDETAHVVRRGARERNAVETRRAAADSARASVGKRPTHRSGGG